jgi:hypothetical protein
MSLFAIRWPGARLAGFLVPPIRLQIVNSDLLSAIQKGAKVSNYTVEELITRWKREELTIEQAIGQILLLLKEQEQRLRDAAPPHDRAADRTTARSQ